MLGDEGGEVTKRPMLRHEAVERHLRMRIAGLQPGDPIESDAELCELFGVSRMTVRQATQRLVAQGAIYRVAGVGTFVGHPQLHRDMGQLRSFTAEMERRGRSASSRLVTAELRPGNKGEIAELQLPPRSNVVSISRVRLADDEPMSVETSVLPPAFSWLLDEDLEKGSLHALLTQHGFQPAHATGTQVAELATDNDAQLLQLDVGAAMFVERRLVTTSSGMPIESTESRYAGSRFVFHIELDQNTTAAVV